MFRYFPIILAVLSLAMRPPASAQSDLFEVSFFLRSEVRSESIRILDIGSGRGVFLPRLKRVFERIGFKDIEIIGIDDGSSFDLTHATAYLELMDFYAQRTEEGIKLLTVGIGEARRKLSGKFDFIFINAPPMDRHLVFLEHASSLVKDDGFIFLRYHKADLEFVQAEKLRQMIVEQNWYFIALDTELPEGDFPLDTETFIIRKRVSPENDQTLLRSAFAKLMQEIRRSEVRKSA